MSTCKSLSWVKKVTGDHRFATGYGEEHDKCAQVQHDADAGRGNDGITKQTTTSGEEPCSIQEETSACDSSNATVETIYWRGHVVGAKVYSQDYLGVSILQSSVKVVCQGQLHNGGVDGLLRGVAHSCWRSGTKGIQPTRGGRFRRGCQGCSEGEAVTMHTA